MKKKFLILVLVIIYFTFYTPKYLSNILLSKFIINLTYKYINNYINYKFNHRYFDGRLVSHYIKNNLWQSKKISSGSRKVNKYLFLKNERIQNYSLFTSSISNYLFDVIKIQKKKLKIGIVVSTRKNNLKKGNYLKFAIYHVNPNDNVFEICKKHHDSVNIIKSSKYNNKTFKLKDLIQALSFDYIFNSQSELSNIKTIDNKNLTIQNKININKHLFYENKSNKKKIKICNLHRDSNGYYFTYMKHI